MQGGEGSSASQQSETVVHPRAGGLVSTPLVDSAGKFAAGAIRLTAAESGRHFDGETVAAAPKGSKAKEKTPPGSPTQKDTGGSGSSKQADSGGASGAARTRSAIALQEEADLRNATQDSKKSAASKRSLASAFDDAAEWEKPNEEPNTWESVFKYNVESFDEAALSQLRWQHYIAGYMVHPNSSVWTAESPGRVVYDRTGVSIPLYANKPQLNWVVGLVEKSDLNTMKKGITSSSATGMMYPVWKFPTQPDNGCMVNAIMTAAGPAQLEPNSRDPDTGLCNDVALRKVNEFRTSTANWAEEVLNGDQEDPDYARVFAVFELGSVKGKDARLKQLRSRLAEIRGTGALHMDFPQLVAIKSGEFIQECRFTAMADIEPSVIGYRGDFDLLGGLHTSAFNLQFEPENEHSGRPFPWTAELDGSMFPLAFPVGAASYTHYMRTPNERVATGHCDAILCASNYLCSTVNHPFNILDPSTWTPMIYTPKIGFFTTPYHQHRKWDAGVVSTTMHVRVGSIVTLTNEGINLADKLPSDQPREGMKLKHLVLSTWVKLSSSAYNRGIESLLGQLESEDPEVKDAAKVSKESIDAYHAYVESHPIADQPARQPSHLQCPQAMVILLEIDVGDKPSMAVIRALVENFDVKASKGRVRLAQFDFIEAIEEVAEDQFDHKIQKQVYQPITVHDEKESPTPENKLKLVGTVFPKPYQFHADLFGVMLDLIKEVGLQAAIDAAAAPKAKGGPAQTPSDRFRVWCQSVVHHAIRNPLFELEEFELLKAIAQPSHDFDAFVNHQIKKYFFEEDSRDDYGSYLSREESELVDMTKKSVKASKGGKGAASGKKKPPSSSKKSESKSSSKKSKVSEDDEEEADDEHDEEFTLDEADDSTKRKSKTKSKKAASAEGEEDEEGEEGEEVEDLYYAPPKPFTIKNAQKAMNAFVRQTGLSAYLPSSVYSQCRSFLSEASTPDAIGHRLHQMGKPKGNISQVYKALFPLIAEHDPQVYLAFFLVDDIDDIVNMIRSEDQVWRHTYPYNRVPLPETDIWTPVEGEEAEEEEEEAEEVTNASKKKRTKKASPPDEEEEEDAESAGEEEGVELISHTKRAVSKIVQDESSKKRGRGRTSESPPPSKKGKTQVSEVEQKRWNDFRSPPPRKVTLKVTPPKVIPPKQQPELKQPPLKKPESKKATPTPTSKRKAPPSPPPSSDKDEEVEVEEEVAADEEDETMEAELPSSPPPVASKKSKPLPISSKSLPIPSKSSSKATPPEAKKSKIDSSEDVRHLSEQLAAQSAAHAAQSAAFAASKSAHDHQMAELRNMIKDLAAAKAAPPPTAVAPSPTIALPPSTLTPAPVASLPSAAPSTFVDSLSSFAHPPISHPSHSSMPFGMALQLMAHSQQQAAQHQQRERLAIERATASSAAFELGQSQLMHTLAMVNLGFTYGSR